MNVEGNKIFYFLYFIFKMICCVLGLEIECDILFWVI